MDKRIPVADDYARLERLSGLCAARDGALAWAVYRWGGERYESRVELFESGVPTAVGTGSYDSAPAFSPDGGTLAFLSDGSVRAYDRAAKAFTMLYAAGEWKAVGFAFAPDGRLAVRSRREIKSLPPEGCDWEMPLVAEALHYRNDADHGFTKKYEYRLEIGTELIALGDEDWKNLVWPDDSRLLYARETYRVLDLATKEERILAEDLRPANVAPVLSGNGTYALAGGQMKDQRGSELTLRKINLKTGAVSGPGEGASTGLWSDTSNWDCAPESSPVLCASAEPDLFYAIGCRRARLGVYRVNAAGETPAWESVSPPGGTYLSAAPMPDGKIACLFTDATHPAEVCVLDPVAKTRASLCRHNAWLDSVALSAMERFDAPSLDGKVALEGFLLVPPRPDAPVLLWPHGGPAGFYADAFSLEKQVAAGRGYAVVLGNPRGSTGYGPDYEDAEAAYGDGAMTDLLTLMDAATKDDERFNAARAGVAGGSYGGYMAARMAGMTKRFRAAAVLKAVTNWLFIHFKSQQGGQPVFEEYRDFQDFLVDTVKKSPIFTAGDVDIPTLIVHGEKDQVVPVENAHQFYVAVRDTHPELPVRLVLMPNCCHSYHRDDLRDYVYIQNATLDWLDKYV
jgi:dipeptidyl aminopeptidase/acylaminoacyl peptidase